jgi:hypothetical protein
MFSNAVDLKLEFDQYTYQLSPVHLSNPNELYTDNHAFSDQRDYRSWGSSEDSFNDSGKTGNAQVIDDIEYPALSFRAIPRSLLVSSWSQLRLWAWVSRKEHRLRDLAT